MLGWGYVTRGGVELNLHSLQTLPWKLETEETAGTRGEGCREGEEGLLERCKAEGCGAQRPVEPGVRGQRSGMKSHLSGC